MRRYWTIYKTFFVSSFRRELEFRANFIAKTFNQLMWIGFTLLILAVIFRNTSSVAGWSQGESTILASISFFMGGCATMLTFSLTELPTQVRQGTLDFVVTKPVDSQFWVSTRRFNLDQLGVVVASVALLIIGLRQVGATPSAPQWFGFFILTACSQVIFYSMNLALMTTGIWFVRVENLWVLSDSVTQVSRFPIDIYSATIQRALIYGVPLAFLATAPARQLVRGFDPLWIGLGLGWAAVAAIVSRGFWRFALRHYSSASS